MITTDAVLTADLACAGTILTVDGDDLVVDLDGHTITGVGTQAEIVVQGRTGVTIRDGSIHTARLSLRSAPAATVDRVDLTDASLYAGTSDDLTVTRSAFLRSRLQVSGSARATVTRSSFTSSVVGIAGIGFVGAEDAVVKDVSFTDTPVSIAADANGASVSGSTFLRSPVDVSQSDEFHVRRSTFIGSTIRLTVSSRNAVISDSVIVGAAVGIEIGSQSSGARVQRNHIHGNGIGIVVSSPRLDMVSGTTVIRNRFESNATAGLLIQAADNGNAHQSLVIRGNRFTHNGLSPDGRTGSTGLPIDDGMHLDVPTGSNVVVAGNVTIANGDHGIETAPGTVIDGGGNSSTGDPAGCSGVVCA